MTGDTGDRARWGLLGPIEVHYGGQLIPVPGRNHPKVLALLLSEANRTVSVDALVNALWEADPPGTADRQVRNTVGVLRQRLGDAGAAIVTVDNGYRITPAAEDFDLARFRRHAATARRERQAGHQSAALAAARLGLAQWRGPALSGITGRAFDGITRRLELARLDLLAERFDLELALGAEREVIGELSDLVVADPTRQRFVEQLMLALYRDGREPEALETYRHSQEVLADRLGVDPGRRLRELYTAMLRDDPSLRISTTTTEPAPVPPTVAPRRRVPAQLPSDIGSFVGRESELATLDRLCVEPRGLAVITGTGGVGKTGLALRWAHRHRDRFPDGQLYINLRGFDTGEPVTPLDAVGRFLRALGLSGEEIPEDLDEAAALLRTTVSDRRVLLLLDNATGVEQVAPLLVAADSAVTLVTSRHLLGGLVVSHDALPVRLRELSAADSAALVSSLSGVDGADRSALDRLSTLCGRLPLALRVAAANLATRSRPDAAALAAELDSDDRLRRLAVDGDPDTAVSATIGLSYTALSVVERRNLCLAAVIPGEDFLAGQLAATAGLSTERVDTLLAGWQVANLIEQYLPDRFRFHDLLRLFVRDRAAVDLPRDEYGAAMDRLLDWYHAADERQAIPFRNLVTTVEELADRPAVWKAAKNFDTAIADHRDPVEIRRLAVIGLTAAAAASDDLGQAMMHNLVAGTHWAHGGLDAAIVAVQESLAFTERTGDLRMHARHLSNLAVFHYLRGEFDTASELFDVALDIARRSGSETSLAIRAAGAGELRWLMGDITGGLRMLEVARDLSPPAGLRRAQVNSVLVEINAMLGRLDEADRLADESLRDVAALSTITMRRQAFQSLALLRQAHGDHEGAHAHLVEALTLTTERENGEIRRLRVALVLSFLHRGEYERALYHARFCFDSGRDQGILPDEAAGGFALCAVHARLGDLAAAREFGVDALRLFRRMGAPWDVARTQRELAEVLAALGDRESAERYRAEAAATFARLGVAAPWRPVGALT